MRDTPDNGDETDTDRIEWLVRNNQQWVRGWLRARLSDWATADDLAQDVFVTAFLKWSSFRGDSDIQTWLCGIARNHLRNHLRKHREHAIGGREDLQVLIERSCDKWQGERPADRTLEALASCKRKLPAVSQKLLELRYTQGMSVREIVNLTGKSYSALTMQLHRMREILADCITRELKAPQDE